MKCPVCSKEGFNTKHASLDKNGNIEPKGNYIGIIQECENKHKFGKCVAKD